MARLIDKDKLDEDIIARWAKRLPGDVAGRLHDIDAAVTAAPVVVISKAEEERPAVLCLKDLPEEEQEAIRKQVRQQISNERAELVTAGQVFDMLDEMAGTDEMKKIHLGELVLIKVRWELQKLIRKRHETK